MRAGIKEAHPAGIWTDRSVDGPIIGTLVVLMDRAVSGQPYDVARTSRLISLEKLAQQEEDRKAGPVCGCTAGKGSEADGHGCARGTNAAMVLATAFGCGAAADAS